jgi:hypothetical protein
MKAIVPSEQNKECRICYECHNQEEMMSPCICSGSLEFVHFSCLTSWIKIRGNDICSICKSQYIGIQYSKRESSFMQFIREDSSAIRYCVCGLFLIIVLILTVLSGYMAYTYYGFFFTDNPYYKISLIVNAFKQISGFQFYTNGIVLIQLLFNVILMNLWVYILMPLFALLLNISFWTEFWSYLKKWKNCHFSIAHIQTIR